ITAHHSEDSMRPATVSQWDVASGEEIRSFKRATDDLNTIIGGEVLEISPDGKTLAIKWMANDPSMRLLDIESGKELGRVHRAPLSGNVRAVFSPDSRTLALGFQSDAIARNGFNFPGAEVETRRGVALYEARTGKELARFGDKDIGLLAFS